MAVSFSSSSCKLLTALFMPPIVDDLGKLTGAGPLHKTLTLKLVDENVLLKAIIYSVFACTNVLVTT